jgi:muramoyltetrapeptide carboxypeptidase
MKQPPYLQPGDAIGIVAPAGCFTEAEINPALEIVASWGLKVIPGRHLFAREQSFAGTDNQRATDLQQMLDDPEIKAILCARGGYGTVRIINKLNFSRFTKKPKWIAGYSDITVLHSALQERYGIESLHAPMPRIVPPQEPDVMSFDSLRAMLFGEVKEYVLQPSGDNRTGRARGVLTGGNLSVLYSLAGSDYEPDTRNRILFLEDIGEYLYHIDRMIMNMKIRGRLARLKGLIIGDMLNMKGSATGFHKSAIEIIRETVAEYKYPVLFQFPAGHSHPNLAFPLGREIIIDVTRHGSTIKFS